MASKTKSQQIFENELLPHMEALKTYAFHFTFNEDDADDLVQETYMKAHRYIENYVLGTNAKAWLFKILKNIYINDYRKKVRQPAQVDFDNAILKSAEASGNKTYERLSDDIFDNTLGDEVTAALMSIPEELREVLLLCDIESFSYDEIAKTIELPVGTVRSRLFRARNMLKDKLKKYALNLGYKDMRSGGRVKHNIKQEEE